MLISRLAWTGLDWHQQVSSATITASTLIWSKLRIQWLDTLSPADCHCNCQPSPIIQIWSYLVSVCLNILFLAHKHLPSCADRFGKTTKATPLTGKSDKMFVISVKVKLIRIADSTPMAGMFMKIATVWSSLAVPTSMARSFNQDRQAGMMVDSASVGFDAAKMEQFSVMKSSTDFQARVWRSCRVANLRGNKVNNQHKVI